jgi:hypothetical protein
VRYVPDGSLCTASVEQIFPRGGVQRNCFELGLYMMTASPIAPVRVFEATLPTLSVRDPRDYRAEPSSVLGICFRPFIVGQHAPIVHPWPAARRSALPRERFSPLARSGHSNTLLDCPLLEEVKPTSALRLSASFASGRQSVGAARSTCRPQGS